MGDTYEEKIYGVQIAMRAPGFGRTGMACGVDIRCVFGHKTWQSYYNNAHPGSHGDPKPQFRRSLATGPAMHAGYMYVHHDVYGSLYHVMVACGVDDRTCLKRNTLDSIALVLYFRLFGTYVARRSQALGHHGHTHHDIGAA